MIHVSEEDGVICVKMVTRPGKIGRTVYMYLVDGMLIDTGPAILKEELVPFYKEHSFDFVTLTHSHEDHTGTASWIMQNRNVPIYIHPKGKAICENPVSYPKYRRITWGIRDPFEVYSLGTTIQSNHLEWNVIYTPGHAENHVSLYHEESGRLFAGDLFLTPEPKIIMKDESIPLMIESIRKLLNLEFKSLFCSHTGLVPNGRMMLKRKLSYLENLYDKVKDLYHQGYTVTETRDIMFPKRYQLIEFSEGEYDTLHIVRSIVRDITKKVEF
ncbi:MBL fold metallo-hydrolase [Oceanobacillus halophilus]|uniref:MBL fold metallo-hydrolase n=2 Tax=Oceanobacillus halophilus TaxID=930130 RepID=A0A495ABX1_9BACI|nr:MBL fold metallo-hydrolase [Oceanobacillus halophilus]